MSELIRANYQRLFKSRLFWGGMLFMYVVSVSELVSSKIEQLTGAGNIPASVLDSLLYDGALRLSVVYVNAWAQCLTNALLIAYSQ